MDPPLDPRPTDQAHRVACHFPERASELSPLAGVAPADARLIGGPLSLAASAGDAG
jgi:hypothetical protein